MSVDPGDSPPDSLEPAPTEPTADLAGQIIAGRYKVLRALAEGGMSRVFLAEQLDLKRIVALKVLKRPEDLRGEAEKIDWTKRFEREAAVLATLSHPNIVVIHEFGVTDDGLAYLAMEYVEGETLTSHVRTHGPFDGVEAARVAAQIASALEDAHASGSIHRDLKPQNIMLARGRTARVKVLDFGIVKTRAADDDGEKTQEGIRMGSPRYMAPEQVSGDPVSPATDVYALGCLLFYMLTGKPPFAQKNVFQVMAAQLKDTPPTLKSVYPEASASEELEAVVNRCLEKDPAQRFADMEEFLAALSACSESGGDPARSVSTESAASVRPDEPKSRWGTPALVAVACVALIAVFAAVWGPATGSPDESGTATTPASSRTEPDASPSLAPLGVPARPVDAGTPEATVERAAVPEAAELPAREPRRGDRRREEPAVAPTVDLPAEPDPRNAGSGTREEATPPPSERALPSDNLDPWSN